MHEKAETPMKRRVRVTIEYEANISSYGEENYVFHRNQGTYCFDNLADELPFAENRDDDFCLCFNPTGDTCKVEILDTETGEPKMFPGSTGPSSTCH